MVLRAFSCIELILSPQKGIIVHKQQYVTFLLQKLAAFFNDKSEAVRLLNQVTVDLT